MTERLLENPLTANKDKSEEFINAYVEKIFILQQSLLMTFFDHEQIFEDASTNGEIDIEKILKEVKTYPDDFRNALNGI